MKGYERGTKATTLDSKMKRYERRKDKRKEERVMSKEAVGNSRGILKAIFGSQISESSRQSHIKRIKPKFATKCELYHICVFQYAYAPQMFDLDPG